MINKPQYSIFAFNTCKFVLSIKAANCDIKIIMYNELKKNCFIIIIILDIEIKKQCLSGYSVFKKL